MSYQNQNKTSAISCSDQVAPAPKSPAVIEVAFSELENQIERAMKSFSMLIPKIQMILRQDDCPVPEKNQKDEQNLHSVPLAGRLFQCYQSVKNLSEQIDAVRDRVEL